MMDIVIGLVIAGLMYCFYVYARAQNEVRRKNKATLDLVRSEEKNEALERIESLIFDLRHELLNEQRINQELLTEAHKKIFKKVQKIEAFLIKDLSDDEFDSYMAQEDHD